MRPCMLMTALFCVIGLAACGSSSSDESRGKSSVAGDSFLSSEEAQNVLDSIDAICGDTFCAGDYNYHPAAIECTAADGVCNLTFLVETYSEDESFQSLLGRCDPALVEKVPENCQAPELKASGTGEETGQPFAAEILAVEGKQLRVSCSLSGQYKSLTDVMEDAQPGPDALADQFYMHIIDCTNALETLFPALRLPVAPPAQDPASK